MVRWKLLATAMVVAIGTAFVTGASLPLPSSEEKSKTDVGKSVPMMGQKFGFLNFPKMMREYKRALTSAQRLNARRESMSKTVLGLREMQREMQAMPKDADVRRQIEIAHQMIMLSRQIEDSEREIGRLLNNQASLIIGELYDEIHAVSAEIAHDRGLCVLFAYPDASTPEDMERPQFKELKLKPPAAMPFYLDPALDYTDELIERLNARFNHEGGK